MSSEQLLPQRINQVVNGILPIESILEDIDNLSQPNYVSILPNVFNEIIKGCNSKSSSVVDLTTKIIYEMMHNTSKQILEHFNSEEFQKALMYTLRGKTTRFGNKFSMHRQTWRMIEDRVLGFYSNWFQWYMMKEDKVKNIIANYIALKSYNIKFPEAETEPSTTATEKHPQNQKKQIKIEVMENEFCLEAQRDSLQTFLEQYGKMIDQGIDTSIADSIEFKIKEKLIYALSSVLLHELPKNRLKLAISYNQRFNSLIDKLNLMKGCFKKAKMIKFTAKSIPSVSNIKPQVIPQIKQIKTKPQAPKISRMRSLIRSTIAFMSSQPAQIKDQQTKDKVMTKLDETIGDLVKYFDNQDDLDVQNMQAMTKSSLY